MIRSDKQGEIGSEIVGMIIMLLVTSIAVLWGINHFFFTDSEKISEINTDLNTFQWNINMACRYDLYINEFTLLKIDKTELILRGNELCSNSSIYPTMCRILFCDTKNYKNFSLQNGATIRLQKNETSFNILVKT